MQYASLPPLYSIDMDTYHRKPSKDSFPRLILGVWAINVLGLAGITALFMFGRVPIIPEPTHTSQPAPVLQTGFPSPFAPQVITPSPRPPATPFITVTATHVPFGQGPITIGFSVMMRPLEVYRFGSGKTIRLIVAGIHGGSEWNTILLADELIAHIQEHPELIPENITLFILRNLNPDGEARAHGPEGRTNENGVDLNRNWPAAWKKEWSRAGCWDILPTTGGTFPASEPETIALMSFIDRFKPDALISYHAAYLGIFAGGRPPSEVSFNLAEAVAKVTTYAYPPIDTGCDYSGDLADWAAAKGIAAIDIELSDHVNSNFNQNLRVLDVLLHWTR